MDSEFIIYIFHFVLGGIIVTLLYHFSKDNNTIACSIIPAFPTFFTLGYIFIYYFNGNLNNYVRNTIFTFGLDFICMILLLLFIIYTNNPIISFILFMVIYIFIIYYLIKEKYLI